MSTRPTRSAAIYARQQWQQALAPDEDDADNLQIEENDEEWLTNRESRIEQDKRQKAINQRARIWLATEAPRKPLGGWAKGKVWSNLAEMYV